MKAPGPAFRNLESATLLSKVAMFIIGCRQIRAAVSATARVVAAYVGLCALKSARWHPREQYVRKRTAWHRPAGAPHKLLASPYNAHPAAAAAAQPARSAPSRLEDKLRGTSKSHIPTAEENISHHSKHNPVELRYYVP